MLGQVTQLFGNNDNDDSSVVATRTLVARYLQASLDDYVRNQCQPPPEWGQPFPDIAAAAATNNNSSVITTHTGDAPPDPPNKDKKGSVPPEAMDDTAESPNILEHSLTNSQVDTKDTMSGNATTSDSVWATGGNVTLRRPLDTDSFITSTSQQHHTTTSAPPKPGTFPKIDRQPTRYWSLCSARYSHTYRSLLPRQIKPWQWQCPR
jgi:hypothetical protein